MNLSYHSKMILKNVTYLIVVCFVVFIYIKWPFYNYLHYFWSFWMWLFGLLILGSLLERFAMEINNRVRGRDAEEDVQEELEDMPNDFVILSNLNIENRGDIDKIVVGPTGIWVVEVKSHAGYIVYDGNELTRDGEQLEKNFLSQVWAETFAVENILKQNLKRKFKIQPVLVFSDPDAVIRFGSKKINGVYVVGYNWLNKLIKNTVIEHLNYKTIDLVKGTLGLYSKNS